MKFKIGDRVRYINGSGKVYIVSSVDTIKSLYGIDSIDNFGSNYSIIDEDIEYEPSWYREQRLKKLLG